MPASAMQIETFGPELEHFTSYEDLSLKSLKLRYETNHLGKRAGVRVVRVVDDGKSFPELDHLAPHFLRLHFPDGFSQSIPHHLRGGTQRNHGDGIRDVVLPKQRQNEIEISAAMTDFERRTVEAKFSDLMSTEGRRRLNTVRDDFSRKAVSHGAHASIIVI